jgi:hypothetical protein
VVHTGAFLHNLPKQNQASQDEDPEDDRFDRRIHEKPSLPSSLPERKKRPLDEPQSASPGKCFRI